MTGEEDRPKRAGLEIRDGRRLIRSSTDIKLVTAKEAERDVIREPPHPDSSESRSTQASSWLKSRADGS